MSRSAILLFDGVGNLLLGTVLLVTPTGVATWLGIEDPGGAFFPTLFGAVLLGIGVALLLERSAKLEDIRGLGLGGALVINFAFGIALAGWLLVEGPGLPGHATIILWALVVILVGLGAVELRSEILGRSGVNNQEHS